MLDFLEIGLVAYLIGALIEGVNTVTQLYHSLPELIKGAQDNPSESGEPPKNNGFILAIIVAFSIAGAFSWPCRLIHRSMKAYQDS